MSSKKAVDLDLSHAGNRSLREIFTDQKVSAYVSHFKRLFDLTFAILLLPILAPFLAVLYGVVRRDGGPFFFRHLRIGKNGKTFYCLKIRTMVVGAEEMLEELMEQQPELRAEWSKHFKLNDDPRITPIGKILRKTSLDELPQIFNVILGDMSIVGPRPITREELDQYGAQSRGYLAMRPGLTGPWQISGRRVSDFASRATLDAIYARNVNFLDDLRIIFMTLPEVILARGK